MQVQAPFTYAPAGGPSSGRDLFNAFYEATSPVAFDFASGLLAQPDETTATVARAYENLDRAHQSMAAPYHAVPLLAEIYALSTAYPRAPTRSLQPGAGAVQALDEPHRSILHLMERHKFSAENTGAILGLDPRSVVEAHEDARAVAHGVSAALALCPGGMASCPALAAELDPGLGVIAQTERILEHAERCAPCMSVALASPDPIKELRDAAPARVPNDNGVAPPGPPTPVAGSPGLDSPLGTSPAGNGAVGAGLGPFVLGAAAMPAAATGWNAPLTGAAPLPGPAPGPSLASKAAPKEKRWSPLRLWNGATGWQKSGAIMAVLLVAALVVAIAAGGDGEDVAARTNNSSGAPAQANGPNTKAPMPALPSPDSTTTTTMPITSATGVGESPTASPYTGSGSSSGSYSSGSSDSSSGSTGTSNSSSGQNSSGTTTPPQTTAPPATTAPAPQVTSYTWGTSRYPKPLTSPVTRDIDFDFVSTGTSVTYTTSWGTSGNLLAGAGTLPLVAVPIGSQSVLLTITGPGGTATASFQTPML